MTAFIADPLQLLYEKRRKTSPTERFHRFHVDIAIRPVVVKEDATARCQLAFDLHDPVPPELISWNILSFLRSRLTKQSAERPEGSADLVVEENGFAGHRSRERVQHRGREHIIALHLDADGTACLQQYTKQFE